MSSQPPTCARERWSESHHVVEEAAPVLGVRVVIVRARPAERFTVPVPALAAQRPGRSDNARRAAESGCAGRSLCHRSRRLALREDAVWRLVKASCGARRSVGSSIWAPDQNGIVGYGAADLAAHVPTMTRGRGRASGQRSQHGQRDRGASRRGRSRPVVARAAGATLRTGVARHPAGLDQGLAQ